MIEVSVQEKTIGSKVLFRDLSMRINNGEKIAIIGRNGIGKSTLFAMLAGKDQDFAGDINKPTKLEIALTDQEHLPTGGQELTVLDYLLKHNHHYQSLSEIINRFNEKPSEDMKAITAYTNALENFQDYGFYNIENNLIQALEKYQITADMTRGPLSALSGGQKRFVQLVQVEFSNADLILIDEPTNHMDYVAKEAFISWLDKLKGTTVIIISHDRDVLVHVNRMVEIKDLKAVSFRGNYESYLKQNSTNTVNQISQYEITARRIANLQKQIAYARSKKAMWSGTADKKNPFVVMETRLTKELNELKATSKPSFWVDKESVESLAPKVVDRYHKYKDKNVSIGLLDPEKRPNELLAIDNLSLGYEKPLFKNISFKLNSGHKLRLNGRNGAGKSTLVNTIRQLWSEQALSAKLFEGEIKMNPSLIIGYYEQEIGGEYIDQPLIEAIEAVYDQLKSPIPRQQAMKLLARYLFDPEVDSRIPLRNLSGGQRARFQLMRMLANQPNLLILDEPTNHLDLPSIEELENALVDYSGSVLYVSHDSYFARNMGGEQNHIGKN